MDTSWATRKSGLVINAVARVQKLETIFHAIEWAAEKRDGKSDNSPVPIRFIPDNKLSRTDKLLLAFDAHVLSKANNPQQSWGFGGEPPKAVIKDLLQQIRF